ncbi:MAG: ester cyclase [Pseudomonadota bacterium]
MGNSTHPVSRAALADIGDLLSPSPSGRRMPMPGFDDEFVDIVDYIIRITDRIWHERRIELCLDYYAADSVIHTLGGDITGAQTVVDNTRDTLRAFPDRTLDGDNVIWSNRGAADGSNGYYSSHLITSRMTNEGDTEYGKATGRRARIRTIADCVCVNNQVVEEWLARDNASLVMQLGFDPDDVAHAQARHDWESASPLYNTLQQWREQLVPLPPATPPAPEESPAEFARAVLGTVWARNDQAVLPDVYDFRVAAHMTAGRDLYGTLEYGEYLDALHNSLSSVAISVDHVADIPYLGSARDIAVRWSLSGVHSGDGLFGRASGAPIYLLGMTHWRIIRGRIKEETTVFDELALRRQIAHHRLRFEAGN